VGIGVDQPTLDRASRSIAGAVRTAGDLPGTGGDRLLEAARDAFVPALHAWMLLATLICVMGAVVSAIWLPRDRVSRVTATSSVPPPAGVARFDATD